MSEAGSGAVLTACPQCRAAVRPAAPWCTQCYTDLRPAPVPEAAPAAPALMPAAARVPDVTGADVTGAERAGADVGAERVGTAAASTAADRAATWPCTTCGQPNALTVNACVACGAGFLARLRESEPPLLVLPGVGDLSRLGRGQALGLAAGVVLVVLLLVALSSLG